MSDKQRVIALIVAAGSGSRAGGDIPKQFREVDGKAVLAHGYDRLAGHPAIGGVRVVIGADQEDRFARALAGRPLCAPIIGGKTRQQSVRLGLEAIDDDGGADIVLIHDAARPFVSSEVIDRLLAACSDGDAAIPAIPVTDSLATPEGGGVRREDFVAVQTPQAFGFEDILAAHRSWARPDDATDDAEIARAAGISVAIVEGDRSLRKLTFEEDFTTRPDAAPRIRVGMGYDVHAFAPGDHLWLGGVKIAHDRALAGHSDADVVLHALTDAILGAIGEGDIGTHFPPSDPQWKGAASDRFLTHASALAAARGLVVGHCDVTVVCEAPKIGPHREAMRARIAEILAIAPAAVSIKATTTEKLGFTGRGEGIAAQAIATLAGAR